MPVRDPDDQYLRVAMMVMLSLALLAGVCATAIHWLGPVHRPMDRVLPPVANKNGVRFTYSRSGDWMGWPVDARGAHRRRESRERVYFL